MNNDKNLVLGWHTTITPSIEFGINFNKETHKTLNSNFNIGAQIFLKSPMKVRKSKFILKDILKVKEYLLNNNIYLVVHGQYLINFIKNDIEWATKSVIEDIKLLDNMIPDNQKERTGVIIHMGKNVNKESIEKCIENFHINIQKVIDETRECKVKLILETSTKTKNGNDIFHDIPTFGKLKNYLQEHLTPEQFKRLGFCIDTAHIFASGYNISSSEDFENFMSLWDHHIGINNITLFHLNDSKVGLGCCRDLHEQIGNGLIFSNDKSGLKSLLLFSKNNNIPVIIESGGDQLTELEVIQQLIN